MTVTVVFGKTTDGYLHSYDASYATARNGPADGVTAGSVFYTGQNKIGAGPYAVFEGFIGFDYAAIPDTEIVTATMLRMKVVSVLGPGITTQLEARGFAWSGGGLTVADWRTPAQLLAARLDGQVAEVNTAGGKFVFAGSDELLGAMPAVTSMEYVVVTDRARAGTTPTTDEGIAIASADEAGTTNDPALIYTSATRSMLFGVMGAQVQLSDGTWAYLESNAAVAPTISLYHEDVPGTRTLIATIPIGTGATDFATPKGAQAFALIVAPNDNLYVFGRAGNAENSLAGKAYLKNPGSYTWTPVATKSAPMPTISTAINQVVAAYHNHAGGVAQCIVGHTSGPAHPTLTTGVQYATVNLTYLRTGAGSMILTSGSVSTTLMPYVSRSGHHNTYPNEVGSGMDVSAPLDGNASWGFFYSFQHGQLPGENVALASARYILNDTATALSHATNKRNLGYGRKDAAGKVRVVPISPTTACFVSADHDAGYGLTVAVQQHSGTVSGSTSLAGSSAAGEGIASMPDGPAIGPSSAWDCIYNSVENRLWVYYVNALDSTQVMRTSFNLVTMQWDRNEVLVYDAAGGTTIQAIRVERNKPVTKVGLVSIARVNAGVYAMPTISDTFNLAPTAPTLTPKANFDATTAQFFDWTHNDPNNDAQTSYQMEVSNADTGVVAFDSGKVASANSDRTLAGGTLANDVSYRWRVRTYDSLDVVSPWSEYGTFSTSAGGTVTVTSPATDNQLNIVTDEYPIKWTATGTVQAAYNVVLYRRTAPNTLTLVSDSGWVTSTQTTHFVTGMTTDVEHEVWVRVRNAALVVSGTGKRKITPSYATPEVPLITVTPDPKNGFTLITVDNPPPGAPAPGATEWDFETPAQVAQWSVVNGTIQHSTAQAHRNTGSKLMTVTGTPTQTYSRNYNEQLAALAGQRYTCRMWVYASYTGNVTAAIDWGNANGYVSTSAVDNPVQANTWTQISVSGTCPPTGTNMTYGATIPNNPPTGAHIYIDELVMIGASDRPEVTRNEILRRAAGTSDDWEVLGECAPDGTFRDYQAGSGTTYEYKVRGHA